MINIKKAFTLVELIVVITILAILGTIAFISLQGYSADARNSKRTQDLNNLAGAVNIKVTGGTSLLSFADNNTTNAKLTANSNVAGTGTTENTDYAAGVPNYTALGIKAADFKDPNGSEYRIGVITTKNGQFEFAASMENSAGTQTAKINGTYNSRNNLGTITASSTGTKTITLNYADINKFFKNDYIGDGSSTGKITKVSTDLRVLTTDIQIYGTGITLGNIETKGLIESTTIGTPVTNELTDLPY